MTSTPPTFIQEVETVWNTDTTPKTTAAFDVKQNDVLVAYSMVETFDVNTANPTISDNTSGALTWTPQQSISVTDYSQVFVWTTIIPADRNMTVSFSKVVIGGFVKFYGGGVITFRNSSGVGVSTKTNVDGTGGGGAPFLVIQTTQNNSAIVVVNADWVALSGASRVWRTDAYTLNETSYFNTSTRYTIYAGYHNNAIEIRNYGVGLLAPGLEKYSIVAIEIKGTSTATVGINIAWLKA
jgi:hypothetical protein